MHSSRSQPLTSTPAGFLNLRVTDEGIGFDPDSREANEGLGLLSMEERLHGMGGRLSIQSSPGGGTCVEAILPLPSLPLEDAISGSKSLQ